MEKIGYELYSKLLREELSGKEEVIPELDVRVTAFIPDDYIESNVARMDAYKEIAEINSLESEEEFIAQATDIYGELPYETENLINIAVVKMLAMKLSVKEIIVTRERVSLTFNDFSAFGDKRLAAAMDKFNGRLSVSMATVPALDFIRKEQTNDEMLAVLREFLTLTV
jgi:transcription-repair coupling factor (superfamily II helicase)